MANRLEIKGECEGSRQGSEDGLWREARGEEGEWEGGVSGRNSARNARASTRVARLETQVGCIWATGGRKRQCPSERRRRLSQGWLAMPANQGSGLTTRTCASGVSCGVDPARQGLARIHVGGHAPSRPRITAARGGSGTSLRELSMRDSA